MAVFGSELLQIVMLSLYVSGMSTMLSSAVGIPLGTFLGLKEFWGKPIIKTATYSLYGFPPVMAGLLVYTLLSRTGPLGFLGWLFSPPGMILAQMIIVVPIITGITSSAVSVVEKSVRDTARTLGASERELALLTIKEARIGVLTAVMVGFGRAISEVGAVLMVGGNIRFQTRVLTTAIVLETAQGNFDLAFSLGAILMSISAAIFYLFYRFQERGYR